MSRFSRDSPGLNALSRSVQSTKSLGYAFSLPV